MRYPQGGGLTAERQEFRERLRLEAAEQSGRGETNAVIAKDLWVSVRSVQRWRQAWTDRGPRALQSQVVAEVDVGVVPDPTLTNQATEASTALSPPG